MRKAIAITALLVGSITPANADVYVKIDANGNAISQAIVCDYSVCGDPNSEFNKYNTNPGERWILQAGNGAQSGFGKSNNPVEQIKVDVATNVWTSTINEEVRTILPEPTYVPPVYIDSQTVTIDTATVVTETATATIKSTTLELLYAQLMALLTQILALIAKLNG